MIFNIVPDIISGDPPLISEIISNLTTSSVQNTLRLKPHIIATGHLFTLRPLYFYCRIIECEIYFVGLAVSLYRKGFKDAAFAYFQQAKQISSSQKEVQKWIEFSASDLLKEYRHENEQQK
jgi:hypothetical protein